MKRIRFEPGVPAEVRAIEREVAMRILVALHRYAETAQGDLRMHHMNTREAKGEQRAG